jgi:uncharacterized protein YggE
MRAVVRLMKSSLFALALGVSAVGCTTNHIQPVLGAPDSNAIVVTGSGEATSAPDIARISLGVEARALGADAAVAEMNAKMNALLKALEAEGIAKKDTRSTNWDIQFEQEPQPVPPPPPPPVPAPVRGAKPGVEKPGAEPSAAVASAPAPVGPRGWYRAQSMVEITVRNLDSIGRVLAAASNAGVNQAWGLNFQLEDPKPLEKQAREKALADARAKAEQLAQAAGVKLGRVISVSDGSGGGGPVFGRSFDAPMAMAMKESAAIERGEVKLGQQVRVVYAIEDAAKK